MAFFRRDAGDELDEIRSLAAPLQNPDDLTPLVDRIADARYVLLGEASHGTAEYYRWRAELTKRLITEGRASFVAVEGDWPDCMALNRWVKGRGPQASAPVEEVLAGFDRWPTWMWANTEVAEFLTWLRQWNDAHGTTVGFYGLDVYSLWDSLRAVEAHLAEHDPDALHAARDALRCFEPYGDDPHEYAKASRYVPTSCEDEVVKLLTEAIEHASQADGDPESELDVAQNAEVALGAERYYRAMVRSDQQSWNVRDVHMADTLDRLVRHHGGTARAVVWEHNTHIGDARATPMAVWGMVNVGQLVRDRHAADGVVLVGFAGHRGSVTSARCWGGAARTEPVPEAMAGSHEALLHDALGHDAVLVFGDDRTGPWLSRERGHRAIGVVYDPSQERRGNFVPTSMGQRYDALISLEATSALRPLHGESSTAPEEEMETEPFGV